jgi:curved DNA-binding protein
MPKTRDYYEVLGVPRTANQKDITSAFRKLARKHHPDLNAGDKASEAKFKEISQAHDVLSDAKKRSLYDEFGSDWAAAEAGGVQPGQGGARGGGFRPQPGGGQGGVQYRTVTPDEMEDLFGGPGGGFGDIFGSIFGGNARGQGRARQEPADVEAPITVSLAELYRGTSRTVELPGGRRVEVKVPAGVKEGTVLRVPGLRARVQIAPDLLFTREGKDLRVVVPVPLHVALRGGEVAAPTLKGGGGQVQFKVAPETQNGTKVRLRGLGLPDPKGGTPGDLYAEVKVQLPVPLDERTRKWADEQPV